MELPIGTVDNGTLTRRFDVRLQPCDTLFPPGQKGGIHSKLFRRRCEREVPPQLEPATLLKKHDLLNHGIPLADLAGSTPLRADEERTRHRERGGMEEMMQVRNAAEVRQIWPTKCNAESYVCKKLLFNSYVVLVI